MDICINIITKIYKLQLITMLFSQYVCGMSQIFVQCDLMYVQTVWEFINNDHVLINNNNFIFNDTITIIIIINTYIVYYK